VFLACLALTLLAQASCGGDGQDRPRITVAAAADLQYAFQELEAPFERQCNCDLVLTFGSSGKFAAQIEEGLPVDVFASANVDYIDRLEDKGLVLAGSRRLYAVGRIVVAVPRGSGLDGLDLALLTDPAIARVSIANPDHAPYGVAAREALQSAGLWDQVKAKLVLGENAAQAAQFIETGDAPAGIIPLSLAAQRRDKLRFQVVDDSLHSPLLQAAAVVTTSGHPGIARDFISFINGDSGRPVMIKYGFVLPGERLVGEND